MNHSAIIRRAAEITFRYRVLWVFGFLVAITGGSGGLGGSGWSGGGGGGGGEPDLDGLQGGMDGLTLPEVTNDWPAADFFRQLFEEIQARGWSFDPDPNAIFGAVALICCGLLLLLLLAIVVNTVGRASIVRMVDAIEEGHPGPSISEGFALGWTMRTLRLFLLNFLMGLLLALVAIPVFLLAVIPVVLMLANEGTTMLGVLLGIGLLILGIPLLIVLVVSYQLASQMWTREVLIGDADIGGAVGSAIGLLRARTVPLLLLWLIMLVLSLLIGIGMIFALLLIMLVAAAVAVAIGAAVYSLAGTAIGAVIVGLPVFMLLFMLPVSILGGIVIVFESSVWTLGWRSLRGRGMDLEPVAA